MDYQLLAGLPAKVNDYLAAFTDFEQIVLCFLVTLLSAVAYCTFTVRRSRRQVMLLLSDRQRALDADQIAILKRNAEKYPLGTAKRALYEKRLREIEHQLRLGRLNGAWGD